MIGYQRENVGDRVRLRALLGGALLGGALLATGVLAGCGGNAGEESTTPPTPATPGAAPRAAGPPAAQVGLGRPAGGGVVSGPSNAPEPESAATRAAATPPRMIYYDLTGFDWYRRGEPLIFEGRSYRPASVLPTGERPLEREGAYEGVDFYVPRAGAAPHDTLYVPVYTGYWLAFTSARGEEQR